MVAEQRDRGRQLAKQIARGERRTLHARRTKRSVWFGLGMYGLVGWSVAIPTIVGVALGAWIDATWPGRFSWTLMLLVAGLIVGCTTAWYWVAREQRDISFGSADGEDGGGGD